MALHKDLTGSELHEPKGVAGAGAGTVYVANGTGSGAWQPRYSGLYNTNLITLCGHLDDVSAPNSHYRFVAPVKCELASLVAILDAAINTADSVVSVYINNVLFADTLTVTAAGSSTGSTFSRAFTTTNTLNAGTSIEIRSDGASSGVALTFLQLTLRAKA